MAVNLEISSSLVDCRLFGGGCGVCDKMPVRLVADKPTPKPFLPQIQDAFNVPLVIQLTDDEKSIWKGLDIEEARRLARKVGRWGEVGSATLCL
jgi:hypothetical protein